MPQRPPDPVTIRRQLAVTLTHDQQQTVLAHERGLWQPFGEITGQHVDPDGALVTVVQPRTAGGAHALAAAAAAVARRGT